MFPPKLRKIKFLYLINQEIQINLKVYNKNKKNCL